MLGCELPSMPVEGQGLYKHPVWKKNPGDFFKHPGGGETTTRYI